MYKERKQIVSWFRKNAPQEFDLWGSGWDRQIFKFGYIDFFIPVLKKNPCYQGISNNKLNTLSKYEFAFCLENSGSYMGYVSEKIYDCFMAGTIPIYQGAPDVTDIIPADTYIDYREFDSLAILHKKLTKMTQAEKNTYRNSAINFIKDSNRNKQTLELWLDIVEKQILKLI